MIARPKISRNERKTTEIGAFEVGNFAPFSCPGWLGSVRGGSRCRAFTLFREPTARLVSAWGFCKRARSDELCGTKALDARNATLRQWARHWRHFATTQLDLAPGRRPDRRRLEAAYDDDDEGAAFRTDAVWVARRDARGDAANDAAAARLAALVAAGSLEVSTH